MTDIQWLSDADECTIWQNNFEKFGLDWLTSHIDGNKIDLWFLIKLLEFLKPLKFKDFHKVSIWNSWRKLYKLRTLI